MSAYPIKTVVLMSLYIVLAGCASVPQGALEQHIGWLHGNCLAIKNPDIGVSEKIRLVSFDQKPVYRTVLITGRTNSADGCHALSDDRRQVNLSAGYYFYRIDGEPSDHFALGFADLDPTDFTLAYCMTSEGIVFSAHSPGGRAWDGYYYLGYESSATCE